MPITDLLTQIEVAPGLPGPLTDSGVTQRAGSKTPPSSDYRDKLARSLNDAPADQSSRTASNAPSSADSSAPDRSVAARDNASTTRSVSPKNAPERSDDTSVPDNSNVTTTPTGSSDENCVQNVSSAAPSQASTGVDDPSDQSVSIDFGIEEPTAVEISNAAIAILTVTAAVPELVKVDDGPTPPLGIYQLLQTDSVSPDADPDFTVATTADQEVQPPSGFVEAIFTPSLPTDIGRRVTKEVDSTSTVQKPTNGTTYGSPQQVELKSVVVAAASEAIPEQPLTDGYAITDVTITSSATDEVAADSESRKSREDGIQTQQIDTPPAFHQAEQSHALVLQSAPVTVTPREVTEVSAGPIAIDHVASVQEPQAITQRDAPSPITPETHASAEQTDKTEQDPKVAADLSHDTFSIKTSDSTKQDATTTTVPNTDLSQSGVTEGIGNNQPVPTHHADQITSTHATPHAASGQLKVSAHSLVDQVSNAMQFANETGRALRVRLHPPELGVLQIEISSKDGVLTARLETQTASAHQAIVENLGTLREALAHTGSRVERIEVQVAENQASDNLSQHADRQDDDPQQQGRQQQRQQETNQEQEDEADHPARPAPNAIDQLDIQI